MHALVIEIALNFLAKDKYRQFTFTPTDEYEVIKLIPSFKINKYKFSDCVDIHVLFIEEAKFIIIDRQLANTFDECLKSGNCVILKIIVKFFPSKKSDPSLT